MKLYTFYYKLKFLENFIIKCVKKLNKAAPRFELGIKDLQSSALPLGHAADRERPFPAGHLISYNDVGLLVVCNGHGEDLIALRVLEQLHAQWPAPVSYTHLTLPTSDLV